MHDKDRLALFSARLRAIKDKERIVQVELAQHLKCSPELVSNWMNGKRFPRAEDLVGISQFTGVSIDYLLGISDIETVSESQPSKEHPFYARLWSLDKTEEVEKDSRIIWDATPDFYWVYDDHHWSELIFENITARGCKYYFLYKKTDENDEKVERLTRKLYAKLGDSWKGLAHYVAALPDEFPGWAEHVLYDPIGDNPRCILISGVDFIDFGSQDKDKDVPNLEFTTMMSDAFAKWFKMLWNKRVADSEWIIT